MENIANALHAFLQTKMLTVITRRRRTHLAADLSTSAFVPYTVSLLVNPRITSVRTFHSLTPHQLCKWVQIKSVTIPNSHKNGSSVLTFKGTSASEAAVGRLAKCQQLCPEASTVQRNRVTARYLDGIKLPRTDLEWNSLRNVKRARISLHEYSRGGRCVCLAVRGDTLHARLNSEISPLKTLRISKVVTQCGAEEKLSLSCEGRCVLSFIRGHHLHANYAKLRVLKTSHTQVHNLSVDGSGMV